MRIFEITEDKEKYMPLLFLADEQEDMIYKYLDKGRMFLLDDNGIKAECVVTDEGDGVLEIKNIAVLPEVQKNGYGKTLIEYIVKEFSGKFSSLQVGTGDSPLTVPFYERCGFKRAHVVKNFFVDNYDHPIYECGVQLVDMVYLKMNMKK